MITLKLKEVVAASRALVDFPECAPRASYRLGIIRNRLDSIMKVIGQQERALIESYGGAIGPDGRIAWPVPKEGEEVADVAYRKAWDDLLEQEETIDRDPVTLDSLLDMPSEKQPALKPERLAVLEKIIVE